MVGVVVGGGASSKVLKQCLTLKIKRNLRAVCDAQLFFGRRFVPKDAAVGVGAEIGNRTRINGARLKEASLGRGGGGVCSRSADQKTEEGRRCGLGLD